MTRGRTCPDLRKTLNDQDCPAEKISRIAKKGRYELERILLRPVESIRCPNSLVTLQDGRAIPKVIDFGIAKAMDQRLTNKTLGAEAPATLRTMSRIASLYGAMGNNEKSVAQLREVLAIQQRVLGTEHEDAINTQQELVSRLFETRIPTRQEEALGLARDLLAHLDEYCGEDHPLTRCSRDNWLLCRKEVGETLTAEEQALIEEPLRQMRQERKDKAND